MCPACVATTVALIAAGAGSAGGVTALIVKTVGGWNKAKSPEGKIPAETGKGRRVQP